jgi:hypothetical protein
MWAPEIEVQHWVRTKFDIVNFSVSTFGIVLNMRNGGVSVR